MRLSGSHRGHPSKHLVQLVRPVCCTNPDWHCPGSQFPAPLISHLLQLYAQAVQTLVDGVTAELRYAVYPLLQLREKVLSVVEQEIA